MNIFNNLSLRLCCALLIIASFLLPQSCEKRPFDYRNKYTGTWIFYIEQNSFNMQNATTNAEVFTYEGRVWYKNKKDSKISIEYRQGIQIDFEISEDGLIFNDDYYPMNGAFSNSKTMEFTRYTGGLGGGSTEKVSGKKF